MQAGVEELHGEGQAFIGPQRFFGTVADSGPVAVGELGKGLRSGRGVSVGSTRQILRFGLYVGEGEGRDLGLAKAGSDEQCGQQGQQERQSVYHKETLLADDFASFAEQSALRKRLGIYVTLCKNA